MRENGSTKRRLGVNEVRFRCAKRPTALKAKFLCKKKKVKRFLLLTSFLPLGGKRDGMYVHEQAKSTARPLTAVARRRQAEVIAVMH